MIHLLKLLCREQSFLINIVQSLNIRVANLFIYFQAWCLWNQGKTLELIEPTLCDPCFQEEVLRCIHVGLLCVQEFAKDRPTIAIVVSMLCSEITRLPTPKKPPFTEMQISSNNDSSQGNNKICSINNVTVTLYGGR